MYIALSLWIDQSSSQSIIYSPADHYMVEFLIDLSSSGSIQCCCRFGAKTSTSIRTISYTVCKVPTYTLPWSSREICVKYLSQGPNTKPMHTTTQTQDRMIRSPVV